MDLEEVNCILCGKRNYNTLIKKGGFSIAKCNQCHLIFTNPRPKEAEILRKYQTDPSYIERFERYYKKARLISYNKILDELDAFRLRNRILEIGSGLGYFLVEAQKRGWKALGIEPSPLEVNYAKEKLGVEVIKGSLEEFRIWDLGFGIWDFEFRNPKSEFQNLKEGMFDVVVFWDVLEHLPQPMESLVKAREFLREKGAVVIRVPDASILEISYGNPLIQRYLRYFREHHFPLHPSAHLYHFTPKVLEMMLKRCGFELMELIERDSLQEMPIISVRKKLFFLLGYKLGFPNEFTMIAKKVISVQQSAISGQQDLS